MSNTGIDWHSEPLESIYRIHGGRPIGLNKTEIEHKLKEYGYNELREEARESRLELIISQFRNPLVYVLFARARVILIDALRMRVRAIPR